MSYATPCRDPFVSCRNGGGNVATATRGCRATAEGGGLPRRCSTGLGGVRVRRGGARRGSAQLTGVIER